MPEIVVEGAEVHRQIRVPDASAALLAVLLPLAFIAAAIWPGYCPVPMLHRTGNLAMVIASVGKSYISLVKKVYLLISLIYL